MLTPAQWCIDQWRGEKRGAVFLDEKNAGSDSGAVVEQRKKQSPLSYHNSSPTQQVIRAELIESDTASACGVTASGAAPLLKLCRDLVEAGFDPATPLHAYRGTMLCLRVRSIGEAAQLTIDGRGIGFRRPGAVVGASPVRQNDSGYVVGWIDWPSCSDEGCAP